MATKKQKEELMQTLKFTPVKVNIRIQGYGGESYIGSVSRETYEFFKSKRIDIGQYASDWEEDKWKDIPSQHRIFEPGSPYECDNLFHQSGATMDDSSYLTVTNDETGEDLFETSLDISHLDDQGIEVECGEDFESCELETGSVIFWGGQGEKGCFFDGEITLRKPFDPRLLKITYGNGDDWYICSGVEYDGEDVEGQDGYSTSGKWTEHKFWIVGGEEVYEGEERDDDYEAEEAEEEFDPAAELDKIPVPETFDESMLSPWHPANLVPAHEGEYEVEFAEVKWPWPMRGHYEFRDGKWSVPEELKIKQWRGLKEPA